MSEGLGRCPVKHDQLPVDTAVVAAATKCPVNHGTTRLMKAVRIHSFGGPESMVMEQIQVPTPGENEVLVRLFTIGVNPVDVLMREGTHFCKPLPLTLGVDGAGIVDSVGTNITNLKVGERVYVSEALTGTYAEYCLTKQHCVHRLHDNVSFSQAAALPIPYVTAYKALFMVGQAKPGQTVLIHGASGGVGVACCQFARAYGLRVVGTAGTERGRKLVLDNGAHIAVCHRYDGYVEYLKSVTRDEGYHLILEMVANKNLQNDLRLLRKKGTVVVIGSNGKIELEPGLLLISETSIKGVEALLQEPEEMAEISAAIYSGMQQGWLKPVVDAEFPLDDVVGAHRAITEHPNGSHGNIIMSPV